MNGSFDLQEVYGRPISFQSLEYRTIETFDLKLKSRRSLT